MAEFFVLFVPVAWAFPRYANEINTIKYKTLPSRREFDGSVTHLYHFSNNTFLMAVVGMHLIATVYPPPLYEYSLIRLLLSALLYSVQSGLHRGWIKAKLSFY